MINNRQVVDLIERANDAEPVCLCGRHTTPVWRDGAVWLECASLSQPREGMLQRVLGAVTAPAHTHTRIVDAPPFGADTAA
jgi:hypothetical protein